MTVDNRYQNAFAPWQGNSPLSEQELDELRKRAWLEQGILIVSASDKRLRSFEKAGLCRIGARLYCDDSAA